MKAVDILKRNNLKRTSCREGIINVLMSANQALSENEIREQLEGNYDRTTFYRSFKTLEEHHILHKIVVDYHIVKYSLDNSVTHKPKHAHFYCQECQTVRCMDKIPLQNYEMPKGYVGVETEVLIKGTCSHCKEGR